jgi:hypothetical protein
LRTRDGLLLWLGMLGTVVLLTVLGVVGSGCASSASTTVTSSMTAELSATHSLTTGESSSAMELPAIAPADFGFVATYGPYGRNGLDTFASRLTKDLIPGQATTHLRLTDEEMQDLYQDLTRMDIFGYPASLDLSNTGITGSTPISLWLKVRAGGLETTISYVHGDSPKTEQAKAFVAWFEKLRRMIEATPEYQGMPPIKGGYA